MAVAKQFVEVVIAPAFEPAAKALFENTELSPAEIVKKSLTIAGELCIYTNLSHIIETLD